MESRDTASEHLQYRTFPLAGEECALSALRVKEVLKHRRITPVPSSPACIDGVLNLRGNVLPVINLSPLFGRDKTKFTKWSCILIVEVEVESEATAIGLIADSVGRVIEFLPDEILPVPAWGTTLRADGLEGMASTSD